VNNVPIARAVNAGATRIFVLLCGHSTTGHAARRPIEAMLSALFVAIHARFARELAELPPGVEVTVFSGGGEPSSDYSDFSGTEELIAEGVGRSRPSSTGTAAPHTSSDRVQRSPDTRLRWGCEPTKSAACIDKAVCHGRCPLPPGRMPMKLTLCVLRTVE